MKVKIYLPGLKKQSMANNTDTENRHKLIAIKELNKISHYIDRGMAVASGLFCMNTNMMTICNIINQKQGTGVVTLDKSNPANGQRSTDETITSQGTIDNNCDKSKYNKNKNNEPKFNDALREKMKSKTSEEVDDSKNKQEKDLSRDKPEVNLQEMPDPASVIHAKPEKEIDTIIDTILAEDRLSSEPSENTSEIKPVVTSSTEVAAGNEEKGGTITLENTESTVTVDIPAGTPSISIVDTTNTMTASEVVTTPGETNDSSSIAPENRQIPIESTQTIQDDGTDQQELTSQREIFGGSKTSSNVELPSDVERLVKPEIPGENRLFDAKKADNMLPNKDFSNFTEKPALPQSQQNISITQEEQPKNTVQDSMPPQKSDVQTETHSAQAFIHKMNVSMEQINSLKAEKQQNLPENKDFISDFDVNKQLSVDTTSLSAIAEKPPVSGDSVKTFGNANPGLGLGRQIQESVSSSYRPGTQQIVIRLDPPDLGRVTIRFIEQRDGITGILHVDKPQTEQEIQRALPAIIQNLQHSDVQIKKLEVVLNNQQQDNTAGEQSTNHNANSGQQNSPGQNSFGNTLSYNEWLANLDNINNSAGSQIELTDKSINMLI